MPGPSQPARIGLEEFIEATSRAVLRAVQSRQGDSNGGGVTVGVWFPEARVARQPSSVGSLLIAFPTEHHELRLVFSEPVDRESAERVESYSSQQGLRILGAVMDPEDPRRVTLTTEPMDGDAMITDVVRADGVRLAAGPSLAQVESPPFIQGIASIPELQKPQVDEPPFTSRFEGLIATASCQKDGGVNSNRLIDSLGYQFLHREIGGPFNSIKVYVGLAMKHVLGIEEEVERLSPRGLSPHVLWSGGVIRNVDGETRLTDTGFMEGSIMKATPKKFPPPFLIQTSDLADPDTLRAKSLQGVIVRFENVTIDSVSEPNERRLRPFVFHDESGAQVKGLLFWSITRNVEPGNQFKYLRGIVDRPSREFAQVIVELDEHLK